MSSNTLTPEKVGELEKAGHNLTQMEKKYQAKQRHQKECCFIYLNRLFFLHFQILKIKLKLT